MQGLYAIVDLPHAHGLAVDAVTLAMLGDRPNGGERGASVVQLRAKGASTEQRVAWATAMVAVCRPHGVPVVVNDDLDAAVRSGADGVHLGWDDPGADDLAGVRARARAAGRDALTIGLSTHDVGQLRDGGRRGPDYLAFGPVRSTASKANPDPVVGLEGLLTAARIAARPLVAIGGLDAESGARCLQVGAAAVAVIGALRAESVDAIRGAAISLSERFQAAARPLDLDAVAARVPVLDRELLADLARWGDSLATHVQLKLPARFRPWLEDGQPRYRPSDVLDLEHALGKRADETWAQWHDRDPEDDGPIVHLRRT